MNNSYLIITGASQGIGLATAKFFLQQGWQVINISRSPCSLPQVHNLISDLTNSKEKENAIASVKKIISTPTTISLIHNAAVSSPDSLENLQEAKIRYSLELQVIAPAILNQAFLPLMAAQSSILYVGSTLSLKATPNAFSYTTSKHAQIGLMRSTCQDLFGKNIHTACICPGFTDTQMLRDHMGSDPQTMRTILEMVSFKRLIDPKEIAETLYFCATHPVINGSVIQANLGQREK